jgi:transcriptional regulator with XRE-family HTH domain
MTTMSARTVKLVRLREGVYASGAAVCDGHQPSRVVHLVDVEAELDAPEGVTVCCGTHFAPGTLVEVPWATMSPHRMCQKRFFDPVFRQLNGMQAMDLGNPEMRKLVAKALGDGLRRIREERGWSRAQLCALLPSGIGERTLLSYEHGVRELSVLRLLELCMALGVEPTALLGVALQRAMVIVENLNLHIDLRALLDDLSPKFRPMHQWARNKLNQHPDGVTELAPVAVAELADFIGCGHGELATHLARFLPDMDHESADGVQ